MAQPHPSIAASTLRSLQRVDPGITRTLAQAGYVVAYRDLGEGKWEKMGVEGGLFVYESKSTPPHGLIILNRNGIKNWQKPLLPRRTSITVQGAWVYVYGLDMDSFRPAQRVGEGKQGEGEQQDTPTRRRGKKTDGGKVENGAMVEGKKTRVALYCHSVNNVAGNEEASRLAEFLNNLCGPSEDEPAPQTATTGAALTETTSLPVMPTRPTENPVSPAPANASQASGMSMAALLEKLQAPNTPQRELPHSSSFPSTQPSNGVASPHGKPVGPAGAGAAPGGDLTMALKQMMGLKVTNTPTQQSNGNPNLQTPTRTPATVERHVATPPPQQQQIHLAPALGTPHMHSPHVRPSLPGQTSQPSFDSRSGYIPYPPQGYPLHTQHPGLPTYPSNQSQQLSGYPHVNTMSPQPSFQGHNTLNGDVFAARGGHLLNQSAATQAVVNAWNRQPQHRMPEQGNPEQKREFVNALLGAIQTDPAFVDRLWQEYCAAQRRYVPPG